MEICNQCLLHRRRECKPEYFMQLKMTYICEHFYSPTRLSEKFFIRSNPDTPLHILRKICEPEVFSEDLQDILDKYLKEHPDGNL